jgi:rhamnogalacturonan endolyase
MHDPVYRLGIAWQNTAYNQPPHLGFYIGDGLENLVMPDINLIRYNENGTGVSPVFEKSIAQVFSHNGNIRVIAEEDISSISVYSVLGKLIHQNSQIHQNEYTYPLNSNEKILIVNIRTATRNATVKLMNH